MIKNIVDHMLAFGHGESYLVSFPKVYIENTSQMYPSFRIQDLMLNLDPELIIPHKQASGKISYFLLPKDLKELTLQEIDLKSERINNSITINHRVLLLEEAMGYFFLVLQDINSKVSFIIFMTATINGYRGTYWNFEIQK